MTEPLLPPRIRRLFRLPVDTDAHVGRDVDDELAFHIEMRVRELESTGLASNDALAEARRQFGDTGDVRRHALVVSSLPRQRARLRDRAYSWLHDLRAATRQFHRAPVFSTIAVSTLALGIGANTAMFSVVHHLLLAPLPYADGNRMTELFMASGMLNMMPDGATVDAWRARARSFDDVTIVVPNEHLLDDGVQESRVPAAAIEPNYFSFLGVRLAAGRAFTADDAGHDPAPVAIIGYALWQQRYGGSLAAIGQRIRVDSVSRTIIGVSPRKLGVPFDDRGAPTVWIPIDRVANRTSVNGLDQYQMFGKLRRDVTATAAAVELSAIVPTVNHLASSHGPKLTSAKVLRPQDLLTGGYRRALALLFAAVSAVLIVACANVAHLLLARAWGRQREFAVRAALGAGRARLIRQMLCESIVLAVAGGVFGLLIAWSGLHLIVSLRPVGYDGLDAVHLEPAVVGWTLGISLVSAGLFGFGPALFASVRRSGELLKAGTRVGSASAGARRARGGMIVVEVALSVALLVVAGLLMRTYDALQRVPLGFDPRNLSAVRVSVPKSVPAADRSAVFADILAAIRAIPGVDGASIGGIPLERMMLMGDIEPENGRPAGVGPIVTAGLNMVQPNFFDLAGIRLRGETFSGDTTARTAAPTNEIIINDALARRLWPNGNALGSRMRLNASQSWMTVVGVAEDLAVPGRSGGNYDFQIYRAATTVFTASTIVFRASKSLETLTPSIRRAVEAAYHGAAIVGNVETADGELRDILAGPRFAMALLGVFALVALVLSAVGLYGVISYAVGQRTYEIGVRIALGAQPRDVVELVARESGVLVAAGLLVGLAVAVAASHVVRSFLFGVGPQDAATYIVVSVLLAVVALLACLAPVRRAMRVDPVVALAVN